MARRRFFVPEIRRGLAELTGAEAEHLVRVLRVEAGERYEISDNTKVYLAQVQTARKSLVTFEMLEPIELQPKAVGMTLVVALFKFDHLEWLIEKATELGVTTIRPVEAIRSERGLLQAAAKRLVRWQKIAMEASQQSRRDHLPTIEPAVRLKACLTVAADVRLVLDEEAGTVPILQQLPSAGSSDDHAAMLVGPEGGWTDEERGQIKDAGWLPCSLGSTILRAETAGIAGLAIVSAAYSGRMS